MVDYILINHCSRGFLWTSLLEGHGKPHYILTSNGEAHRVSPGVKFRVHFTLNHHVRGNSGNAKERLYFQNENMF